jgi:hypothetical protein
MEARVFRLVHDTHSAAAQFLDNVIMRYGLTDHCAEILGLEVGQVNLI